MPTIEKSECLPPPRPRSPTFIDTLSSCLRDETQESYLSIYLFILFFFFFVVVIAFFKTKCSCFFVFFLLFFFKPNLQYLEPTFGVVGTKHTQTDTHDRFSKSLYLLRL